MQDTHISLAHGNGGRFMRELIDDIFARHLSNPDLDVQADAVPLDGIDALVADEHAPEALLARVAPAGIPVVVPRFEPEACARVAARRLEAGATVDPLALMPIYPRQPEAVTLWERRHGGVQYGQRATAGRCIEKY